MPYTVAEVAEMLNISPHTIRYYDDQGLLPFLKRDEHGRRMFTDYDVEMLEAVYRGIKVGNLQLQEMQELIQAVMLREDFREGKSVLLKYKNRLSESIEQLRTAIHLIDSVMEQYDQMLDQQNANSEA